MGDYALVSSFGLLGNTVKNEAKLPAGVSGLLGFGLNKWDYKSTIEHLVEKMTEKVISFSFESK